MKITDLISVAENKLASLNNEMATAIQRGDTEAISRLEIKVAETQDTLDTLRGK